MTDSLTLNGDPPSSLVDRVGKSHLRLCGISKSTSMSARIHLKPRDDRWAYDVRADALLCHLSHQSLSDSVVRAHPKKINLILTT